MESYVVLAIILIGVNSVLWGLIGLARYAYGRVRPAQAEPEHPSTVTADRVAVLVAAHNEELVIEHTIASACAHVSPTQVFVASDGSTDATADVARRFGANVVELSPNRGKAGALVAAIEHFRLAERFEVRAAARRRHDARSRLPRIGLPPFDDPEVVAVAGARRRAPTRHRRHDSAASSSPTASGTTSCCSYLLKYGQAARPANVVSIVPGCASMYRTRILRDIEIDAPGLVIEDFNMTFEVHAKRLGRIAFRPGAAVAHTQDPDTFDDYVRQMRRWTLGFWQTVRRHRVRGDRFWGALILYIVELVVSSVLLMVVVPLIVVSAVAAVGADLAGDLDGPAAVLSRTVSPLALLFGVLVPDLVLSVIAAIITRRIAPLRFAPFFPLMRFVDAAVCLRSLVETYVRPRVASGRWTSPVRRPRHLAGTGASADGHH